MNIQKIAKLSAISLALSASYNAQADQTIQDDLIVTSSICVGMDCVNGESFGFDTLRLKENNLRIRFIDTSSSSSFPSRDWQITINDSANGGVNHFSIEDLDAGTTPFSILASAPNNSFYMAANGNIGMGTTTPLVDLSIKTGNSPTIRLEQDASSGFAAQAWDIGGNEANFFVRDVTNGSVLPFRIVPSAPNGSLYIAADGDVGLSTTTPDGLFDIAHSADANNHAFLIDPNSWVGVNIDNGFIPKGLFDVQTNGGISRLTVQSDGDVGIGTSSPTGRFEVKSLDGANALLTVADNGNVGINTLVPNQNLTVEGDTSTREVSLVDLHDTHNSTDPALLLNLKNNGPAWLGLDDTAAQDRWLVLRDAAGDFRISKQDYSTPASVSYMSAFLLDSNGNLTIPGNLIANGTTYTSSIKSKENFSEINENHLLQGIANLNITQWNYVKDGNNIKHIGPMAEDFHKNFGLNGNQNDRISISDISGVSLAAIQVLINRAEKQEIEIKSLKAKLNNFIK